MQISIFGSYFFNRVEIVSEDYSCIWDDVAARRSFGMTLLLGEMISNEL